MTDTPKKPVAKAAVSARPPRKLVPRTAPQASDAPTTVAPPATAPAAKPRAPRKPSEVEQTVAKHQKVLADALVKAQAIKYDQPRVMKPELVKDKKEAKATKPPKAKKVKLVRDSYAMPEPEYARIGELKQRLAALGAPAKKSELLRGGIAALSALNDTELKAVMSRVARIKTGRPSK